MTAVATQAACDPASFVAQAAEAERTGDLARALELGRAAILADPAMPAAWFVLGVAQHRLGDSEAAVASLQRADSLAPRQPEVLHTLGLVALAAGCAAEAIDALRKLAERPGDISAATLAAAQTILANLLCDCGQPEEAKRHAHAALALDPTSRDARLALATSLFNLKLPGEALAILGDVPDDVPSLLLLASAFEGERQPGRAAPLYARVLQLEPQNQRARMRQLDTLLTLCDWRQYDALVAGVLGQVRKDIASDRGLAYDVFNLLALPVDPALILAASRTQAAHHARQAGAIKPIAHRATRRGRIRIGYLLPYTERHSLPQALAGIIERHDRARFEVMGYSMRGCDGTPFCRGFRASFDRMTDVPRTQPAQAAATIREDQVDILVDTTGHTGINALPILARRPAPVQAHYLGYGLTSGADFVDYLITDRNFLGPGGEAFISEAPVFLPNSFMATMRAPIAVEQPSRAKEGLPETGVVFANFNHPCKLDPVTFALWMQILRVLPGSVLWLGGWADGTRQRLRGTAAQLGVSPKRLVFAELAPHPLHLRRLQLADLALDNRLHGGGVTTVDALWAGLPVVSLAGQMPAARLGATLLPAAGVPELVVNTEHEYMELALALARDPDRRTALREKLVAGRDTSPLFDAQAQTRALETAYERMWRQHCAGEPPRMIAVEATA